MVNWTLKYDAFIIFCISFFFIYYKKQYSISLCDYCEFCREHLTENMHTALKS